MDDAAMDHSLIHNGFTFQGYELVQDKSVFGDYFKLTLIYPRPSVFYSRGFRGRWPRRVVGHAHGRPVACEDLRAMSQVLQVLSVESLNLPNPGVWASFFWHLCVIDRERGQPVEEWDADWMRDFGLDWRHDAVVANETSITAIYSMTMDPNGNHYDRAIAERFTFGLEKGQLIVDSEIIGSVVQDGPTLAEIEDLGLSVDTAMMLNGRRGVPARCSRNQQDASAQS